MFVADSSVVEGFGFLVGAGRDGTLEASGPLIIITEPPSIDGSFVVASFFVSMVMLRTLPSKTPVLLESGATDGAEVVDKDSH